MSFKTCNWSGFVHGQSEDLRSILFSIDRWKEGCGRILDAE